MISRRAFFGRLSRTGAALGGGLLLGGAFASATAWLPSVALGDVEDYIGRGRLLPSPEAIRSGSADYWKLADMINDYRAANGLHRVLLSSKLTAVALLHARDLYHNRPHEKSGSLHSWSKSKRWHGGAFKRNDETTFSIMWDKPKELFGYPGYGFEVSVRDADTMPLALKALQASKLHNDVLLNRGLWRDKRWNWQALGAVYYKGFACAWFGAESDAVAEGTKAVAAKAAETAKSGRATSAAATAGASAE